MSREEEQILQGAENPAPTVEEAVPKSLAKARIEERSRRAKAKHEGLPPKEDNLPVVTRERPRVTSEKEQPRAREAKKRKRSPSSGLPSKGRRESSKVKHEPLYKKSKSHHKKSGSGHDKAKGGPERNKDGQERKKRRFRPGTVAIREIKHYQKFREGERLIPRSPFNRVINEILASYSTSDGLRMTRTGREALREMAEVWLTELMDGVNHQALHSGRQTALLKDLKFHQFMCQRHYKPDLAKQ